MTNEELIKVVAEERARIVRDAQKGIEVVRAGGGNAIQAVMITIASQESQSELLERAYAMCDEHKIARDVLGSDEFFAVCDAEIERLKAEGA